MCLCSCVSVPMCYVSVATICPDFHMCIYLGDFFCCLPHTYVILCMTFSSRHSRLTAECHFFGWHSESECLNILTLKHSVARS